MARRAAVFLVVCFAMTLGITQTAEAASPRSPYLVTRVGNSYSAQSQTTPGSVFTGTAKSVVEKAVADLNGSGGGTVRFAAGTFDFGSEYIKPGSIADITFEGAGIDATIIQNASSVAGDTEPFNFSGALRVTIRDLTISAGGPPRTTSDAIDFDNGNYSTVERVKISASRGRAIVFDGKNSNWTAVNNVVRGCVITSGVLSDGIELLASSSNLIEGCTITGVGGHGIQLAKSSTTTSGQKNKKSSDNIIRNNVIDNSGQDGINFNGGDGNRVEGNQITNNSNISSNRDGIRIGTGDLVSCNDNVIVGNTATDNQATKTQRYGLAITSSLCNRTVVGTNNFAGNRVGPILDQGTGTQNSGGDVQAPSVPTGVAATALSASLVRVSWNASTDNVGVTGYRIYRNGSGTALTTVSASTLTFDDTSVGSNTTYTYRVSAFDAANLASAQSTPPASATTPVGGTPGSPTFNSSADSYVNETSPATNYGSSTQCRIDGSPILRTYLRFDVQNLVGTITSAKLRIYANSGSSTGHEVRTVADNSWGEASINYGNAPAVGAVVGSSGPFAAAAYIEVDVTAVVTGNGTYSFALTGPGTTAISYASRESGNKPVLLVNTA